MVDHIVDASTPRGRIEIRTGTGRRRRWSNEAKGRMVAESFKPGAVVSEVARQHDLSPQHLFTWRKAERAGLLTLASDPALQFVPIVTEAHGDGPLPGTAASDSAAISIEIGGAIVRAARGVDPCSCPGRFHEAVWDYPGRTPPSGPSSSGSRGRP
jgi:transposase